jgi:phosphatidylserine/phosphatidylglycerophosphate/cardiolipin synthase-like enzyme
MNTRMLMICFVFLCMSVSVQEAAGQSFLELVESIPLETAIDNPEIRNTQEVWIEMLTSARRTIDVEQFYISDKKGEALAPVLDAMRAALKRGVHIRLLVDKSFSTKYPETIDEFAKLGNAEVRRIEFSKFTGRGIQHAKFFIVDDCDVFFGSQNFDWRALSHIHEIGVRMNDARIARFYMDIFESDWSSAGGGRELSGSYSKPLRNLALVIDGDTALATPVASPVGHLPDTSSWDENAIIAMMDGAKKEVCVQVLSYSPVEGKEYYDALESAMRRAAIRGVHVNLLVSDWSIGRNRIGYLKSLAACPNIAVRISSIPDFSGGFISFARVEHCKYMVVDERAVWIGTNNWSADYFHNSRNVGVLLQSVRIASRMKNVFLKSWDALFTAPIDCNKEYQSRKTDDGTGK